MKRVCKQQSRVSGSERGARHLIVQSPTHKRDREQAARLLSSDVVVIPKQPALKEAFPFINDVSFICACKRTNTGAVVEELNEEESVAYQRTLGRERSFYWSFVKCRKDKEGSCKKRKRKVKAPLIKTFLSLPPWWSKALAEAVVSKQLSPEQLKAKLLKLAESISLMYAVRSGYERAWAGVHAENKDNVHFELGFSTIDKDNNLLGRSADGKRGRKGLRTLHPSFLALWRLAHVQNAERELSEKDLSLPKQYFQRQNTSWDWKAWNEGELDDVAAAGALDGDLRDTFPTLVAKAERFARSHQEAWLKDRSEAKTKSELQEEVRRQRAQLRHVEDELAIFERTAVAVSTKQLKEIAELKGELSELQTTKRKVHPALNKKRNDPVLGM